MCANVNSEAGQPCLRLPIFAVSNGNERMSQDFSRFLSLFFFYSFLLFHARVDREKWLDLWQRGFIRNIGSSIWNGNDVEGMQFVELRGAGSSRIFYLTGTGSSFLIRARPTISDLVQTKWKSVTREAGTWQVKRSDWTVSRFMRVTRLNNDHRATVHGLTWIHTRNLTQEWQKMT